MITVVAYRVEGPDPPFLVFSNLVHLHIYTPSTSITLFPFLPSLSTPSTLTLIFMFRHRAQRRNSPHFDKISAHYFARRNSVKILLHTEKQSMTPSWLRTRKTVKETRAAMCDNPVRKWMCFCYHWQSKWMIDNEKLPQAPCSPATKKCLKWVTILFRYNKSSMKFTQNQVQQWPLIATIRKQRREEKRRAEKRREEKRREEENHNEM